MGIRDSADGTVGGEKSPFGFDLGITYPHVPAAKLVAASKRALQDWRRAGPQAWVGVSLEILARLNLSLIHI